MNRTKPLKVLVCGPNGCGKNYICTTVLPMLGIKYKYQVLSDWLKKYLPEEELIKMTIGELVSCDSVCKIFQMIVDEHDQFEDPDCVLFIDGFPRKQEQVQYIHKNFDHNEVCLLHVEADYEVCKEATLTRKKSGVIRDDDSEYVFEKRWMIYEDEVKPALQSCQEFLFTFTAPGGKKNLDEFKLLSLLRMLTAYQVPIPDPNNFDQEEFVSAMKKIPEGLTFNFFPIKEFVHVLENTFC